MDSTRKLSLVGLTLAGAAVLNRLTSPRQHPHFPWSDPETGRAAQLRVDWMNKNRNPIPTSSISSIMHCTDTEKTLPFEELMESKHLVAFYYDLDRALVVFLEVLTHRQNQPLNVWKDVPFLDRGVREHSGQHAYIASFDTIEAYLKTHPFPQEAKMCWVWNTGRCGSTLMHRLMVQTGTCSLTEPFWMDQFCNDAKARRRAAADPHAKAILLRAVRLISLIDFQLARHTFPEATVFSVNPKSNGHLVRPAVLQVFPDALHMFMYRDALKVVESFASIIYGPSPSLKSQLQHSLMARGWHRMERPSGHAELDALLAVRTPGPIITHSFVEQRAWKWLKAMYAWVEESRAIPTAQSLVLRMDEFVGHKTQTQAVSQVLAWLGLSREAKLDSALSVFKQHSQKGSKMAKSSSKTGKNYLQEVDKKEILQLLSQTKLFQGSNPVLTNALCIKQTQ